MKINLNGIPIAQQRHRYCRSGNKIICYNPQAKEKEAVKGVLKKICDKYKEGSKFFAGSVFKVKLDFYLPNPICSKGGALKSFLAHANYHTRKPDIDNLIKFYLDCISGTIIPDDKCIVELHSSKQYDHNPRTEINIMQEDVIELPLEVSIILNKID